MSVKSGRRWNALEEDTVKIDIILNLTTRHRVEELSERQKALINLSVIKILQTGITPYEADNSQYWALIDKAVEELTEDLVKEKMQEICNAPRQVLEIRLATYCNQMGHEGAVQKQMLQRIIQELRGKLDSLKNEIESDSKVRTK